MSALRSALYAAARALGDAEAASKGPAPYARRRARRAVLRVGNRSLARAMRRWGL